MYNRNVISLIGNIAAAPEIKTLDDGRKVASLRLCTNESWKDDKGERQEKATWHNITVWNPGLIEKVLPHMSGGDYIFVEGKMTYRTFEKEGQKHERAEVKAAEIGFLTPRKNDQA